MMFLSGARVASLLLVAGLADPARAQFGGCPVTGTWTLDVGGGTFIGTSYLVEDGAGAISGYSTAVSSGVPVGPIVGSRTGPAVTVAVVGFEGFAFNGTQTDCDVMSGSVVGGTFPATMTRVRGTYCGDGTVQSPEEQCDDGNFVDDDACSASCLAGCGNGVVGPGEECDDGNLIDGDGCTATCELQACGNGDLEPGEGCDDGNAVNGDGCSSGCLPNVCGNTTAEPGEQCDDGNVAAGDGCSPMCQLEGCVTTGTWQQDVGSGAFVNRYTMVEEAGGAITGYTVAVTGSVPSGPMTGTRSGTTVTLVVSGFTSFPFVGTLDGCDHMTGTIAGSLLATVTRLRTTYCGDGVVQAPDEACDDGNFLDGDGCTAACVAAGCGNGVVEGTEACDDGNLVDGDGCTASCTLQVCGNGTVEAGETCDDGNGVNGDGCSTTCSPNVCGNDAVESGEGCDDGNAVAGDGCSALCAFEGCSLTGTWYAGAFGYRLTAVEAPDGSHTMVSWPQGSPAAVPMTGSGSRTGTAVTSSLAGFNFVGTLLDCDTLAYSAPIAVTWVRVRSTWCGDGVVQAASEACDDGNLVNGDGCSLECSAATGCGNGVVDAGEACDDGNANSTDACTTACAANVCGDGVVRSGVEACDDGNVVNGDGCPADCQALEPEAASGTFDPVQLAVSTDDESDGATPGDPIEVGVVAPPGTTAGTASITETTAAPPPPTGFALFGTVVDIDVSGVTPPPTPASPLAFTFEIHGSLLPPGQDETTIEIRKDGVPVAACTGPAGEATPDPCVAVRARLASGSVAITVLTTTASEWTLLGHVCGSRPALGCRASVPTKSKLKLVQGPRPSFVWSWKGADAALPSVFGAPATSGDQIVCLYDATSRRLSLAIPAAGTCGAKPCWKTQSAGFGYVDRSGARDGVTTLTLKAGAAGKAKIALKASRGGLLLPTLPLAPSVRVQLRSEDGACFEAAFSTPVKHDALTFKARSD